MYERRRDRQTFMCLHTNTQRVVHHTHTRAPPLALPLATSSVLPTYIHRTPILSHARSIARRPLPSYLFRLVLIPDCSCRSDWSWGLVFHSVKLFSIEYMTIQIRVMSGVHEHLLQIRYGYFALSLSFSPVIMRVHTMVVKRHAMLSSHL